MPRALECIFSSSDMCLPWDCAGTQLGVGESLNIGRVFFANKFDAAAAEATGICFVVVVRSFG